MSLSTDEEVSTPNDKGCSLPRNKTDDSSHLKDKDVSGKGRKPGLKLSKTCQFQSVLNTDSVMSMQQSPKGQPLWDSKAGHPIILGLSEVGCTNTPFQWQSMWLRLLNKLPSGWVKAVACQLWDLLEPRTVPIHMAMAIVLTEASLHYHPHAKWQVRAGQWIQGFD